LHPAVAGLAVDRERGMAHAQPRVAALLDVALRSAEAAHQEVAQPLLGAGEIRLGIHWSEDVVGGDLAVEQADEALEAFLADGLVDLCVVQDDDRNVKSPYANSFHPGALGPDERRPASRAGGP